VARIDPTDWWGSSLWDGPGVRVRGSSPGAIGPEGWITGETRIGSDEYSTREQIGWLYRPGVGTIHLGLTDAEHVSPLGEIFSSVGFAGVDSFTGVSRPGLGIAVGLIGTSKRYDHGERAGLSAWVWHPMGGYTIVGLTDAEHTSSNGDRVTLLRGAMSSDLYVGTSDRFDGVTWNGTTAFAFSRTTGTYERLGFTDARHTRADGYRLSYAGTADGVGGVIGLSTQFAGSSEGQSLWRWAPDSGLVTLGLTDAEHTRSDGLQMSASINLNTSVRDRGRVVGKSTRYIGTASAGETVWWYSPQTGTLALGYRDESHTAPSGRKQSSLAFDDPSGWCSGTSILFFSDAADDFQGLTAWVWSPSQGLNRAGLTDAAHTQQANGRQRSSIAAQRALPGDGVIVAGTSQRLGTGFTASNQSAWVWTPAAGTREVGLRDVNHTNFRGDHNDRIALIAPSGSVAGYSDQYPGDRRQARGVSAWVWSATTGTVNIEPQGTFFVGPAGARSSIPRASNQAGQMVGDAAWYSPVQSSVAWFFDPVTMVTTPLIFDQSSDGNATTMASVLTESGAVFGQYEAFEGAFSNGMRSFVWSAANGMMDLEDLPQDPAAWERVATLYGVRSVDDVEQILVTVQMDAPSPDRAERGVYLMSRITPCVADFNGDGGIDGGDVDAFFAAWEAGATQADVNHDGGVNTTDAALFFERWERGGC
jgi:hypothetical protein